MVFGFCHHLSLLERRKKITKYILVDIIYCWKNQKEKLLLFTIDQIVTVLIHFRVS